MCKKHYDIKNGEQVCTIIKKETDGSRKISSRQHTRRESFRGDDATVEAIFKGDSIFSSNSMRVASTKAKTGTVFDKVTSITTEVKGPKPQRQRRHKRGISLFADEAVTNSILENSNIMGV